jgi:hypothetical protein
MLISSNTIDTKGLQNSHGLSYSIKQVISGSETEYQFNLDNRHFGTLIDQEGTYAFRPHPGCDIDGWGSTLYLQPFLPGAILKHTTYGLVLADSDGIHINASGHVSRAITETYGTWNSVIDFTFNPVEQVITGTGQYTITLEGRLSETTGDLNLYKLASNYLDDVPLLLGGIGDTGDMKEAVVRRDPGSIWFIWIPPDQPSYFPTEKTDFLSIDVIGQFNNIDTKAQQYESINPAFKPSLKVILTSPRTEIMFGAIYDVSKSQDFWEDNVGITPIISKTSLETEFHFNLVIESSPLETCAYLPFN